MTPCSSRTVFNLKSFGAHKAWTVAAIALLVLGASLRTQAQYQLNGDATQLSCNCYELTPDEVDQVGSVWNVNLIDLNDPFDFRFEIFLGCDNGPNTGADGLAFGMQPLGTGVGTVGQGMGMSGISPSIGVFVDTYENPLDNDPDWDHMSLNANGNVMHDGGADDLAGPFNLLELEDCDWHTFRVAWDPTTTTLLAWIDGVQTITYVDDIVTNIFAGDPNVYWGFTSATGFFHNVHQVCTQLSAGLTASTTSLCPGESVDLSDTSISFGQIIDQSWDFGDGTTGSGANVSHSFTAPGTYTVELEITDASGCSDSTEVEITVLGLDVDAGPDETICAGQEVQIGGSPTAPGGSSIIWSPDSTLNDASLGNPLASPSITTEYVVNASNQGCSSSDTVVVFVEAQNFPEFEVYYLPFCDGIQAEFSILSTGDTDILWDFGDGTTSTDDSPTHMFDYGSTISITLTTTSSDGCVGSTTETMEVANFEDMVDINVPNVFTPNNDGRNDVFRIIEDANIAACVQIDIFNRWGQLQYTSSGSDIFWDGRTIAGVEATEGSYFYMITLRGMELKGTLTLLR